jgi:hypothetical protein
MIDQRLGALFGWAGTGLFLISWLMIASINAFSTLLWAALMLAGAAMCLYGAIRRSKWFFLPSIIAMIVTAGVLVSASLE